MPGENRKLLWIAISVCAFVFVALAAGLLLFAPGKASAESPLALGTEVPGRPADPQDFMPGASTEPATATTVRSGDIIIVYGDDQGKETGTTGTNYVTPAAAAPAPAVPPTPATTVKPVAAPAPKPATAPAPAPPKVQKPASGSTAAPSPPVSKPPAPAPAAKSPAPAEVPAAATGSVWIQAGSFKVRKGAEDLKQTFEAKGMNSIVAEKVINGAAWYQVKIGPYPSREEAGKWLPAVKAVPGASAGAYLTSN